MIELDWDLLKYEKHTIVADFFHEKVRCLITRDRTHWCAYVGVPQNHPLAGFDYSEIPLDCHWGLDFAKLGDGKFRPKGFYWYGWSYDHCDDATEIRLEYGNKWTLKELMGEVCRVAEDFKVLVKLSETIFLKGAKIIPYFL